MRIEEAIAETMDAIGDDDMYASPRRLLLEASRLLREGTSQEAGRALDVALAELDAAVPL